MFDFGAWELALIAVIAIFVIGPKELPATLRAFGMMMRKLHNLTVIFRAHVDDMVREAELDELRKTANDVRNGNYGKVVEDTVDPDGEIRDAFEGVDDFDIPDIHDLHEEVVIPDDAHKPQNQQRDEP